MRLKIELILAVLISIGVWNIRGWYEGDKEKEVIEKNIEVFNEQVLVDQDRLLVAEIELDNYKDEVEKLKGKAYALDKGICDNANSYNTFSKLYNQAIIEANKNTTGKLSD